MIFLYAAIIVRMEKFIVMCKKILSLLLTACIIFCITPIFFACTDNNTYDGDLLRLHIRANSNSDEDQGVKLKIRDAVNEYIDANIKKDTFDEAYAEIKDSLKKLSYIASSVLEDNGFRYSATARLVNEYFPTRMYDDVTVPEGYYDALIIELGKAEGDNWWCVIYPPLCYGEDFKYKSIFKEWFGKD